MDNINSFKNDMFYLSNFYEADVEYDGIVYHSNEAAFQAQKCADYEDRKQFADLNPSQAKQLGRSVHLRKDWEQVKVSIMREIVRSKFEQNPDLADDLLATGNAYLEEGNDWGDMLWGTMNGKGANLLGQILMEVRSELAEEQRPLKSDYEYSK